MEIVERRWIESEFQRRFKALSEKHLRAARQYMGDPPDPSRIPASFWAEVEKEQQTAVFLLLVSVFGQSAFEHEMLARGVNPRDVAKIRRQLEQATRNSPFPNSPTGAAALLAARATGGAGGRVVGARPGGGPTGSIPGSVVTTTFADPTSAPDGTLDPRNVMRNTGLNTAARDWATPRARLIGTQLTATTRNRLAGKTGINADVTADSLFGPLRADKVVENEFTRAQTAGGEWTMRRLGLDGDDDIWFNDPGASQTGPCEICEPLHMTPRSVWGVQFPGGPPEPHPNCCCYIVYASVGATSASYGSRFVTVGESQIGESSLTTLEDDCGANAKGGGGFQPGNTCAKGGGSGDANSASANGDVTQTEAFKSWFGNSKVVDASGKPKVVYHGTEAGAFSEFKQGSFFTEDKSEARAYSRITDTSGDIEISVRPATDAEKQHRFDKWGDIVTEPFDAINIDKKEDIGKLFVGSFKVGPDDYEDRVFYWDGRTSPTGNPYLTVLSGVKMPDWNYKGANDHFDPETETYGVIATDTKEPFARKVREPQRHVHEVYLSIQNPVELPWQEANLLGRRLGADEDSIGKEIAKYKAMGYDGIKTISDEGAMFAGKEVVQWIPFSPSQIKTTKAKKFDSNSPNINESLVAIEADDCGANGPGGGGFQPGNTCGKGDGSGGEQKADRRQFKLVSNNVRGDAVAGLETATKSIFGSALSQAQVADMAGGLPEHNVRVRIEASTYDNGDSKISVNIDGPSFKLIRSIEKQDVNGEERPVIKNVSFMIKPEMQGKGLGSAIFNHQVQSARQHGVSQFVTFAEKLPGIDGANGYYTWARLGYDAPLAQMRMIVPSARQELRDLFPDAQNVSDLMDSEEGRNWWKSNGVSFEGTFDLDESSRSSRVLKRYMAYSAPKPPVIESGDCGANGPGGGGFQPGNTCAAGGGSGSGSSDIDPTKVSPDTKVQLYSKSTGEVFTDATAGDAVQMLKDSNPADVADIVVRELTADMEAQQQAERDQREAERTARVERNRKQSELATPNGFKPGHDKFVDPPAELYHATFNADDIVNGGFKSSDELGKATLGGTSGHLVSFTTKENAQQYRDALDVAQQAAQGRLNAGGLARAAMKFGVSRQEAEKMLETIPRDGQFSFNFMRAVSFASKGKFPLFMGSDWPQHLRTAGAPQIVAVKSKGIGDIVYNPGEKEWRVGGYKKLKPTIVNESLVAVEDDCGANAEGGGGFQPGNTCAKGDGSGGSSGGAKPGRPAGKVKVYGPLEKSTTRIFGKAMSPDQIADIAGAPVDAWRVRVDMRGEDDSEIVVTFRENDDRGDVYEAERAIYLKEVNGEKKPVVDNLRFIVDERHRGKGLGSKIFADQVESARKAGVAAIVAHAQRGEDWNGYYTWARLGYDAALSDVQAKKAVRAKALTSKDEPAISSLMKTDAGRKWWKKNGDSFDGVFNLNPDSTSSKVLDAYIAERTGKRSASESLVAIEDCGANAPGGGGFQPGNTCGKGDGGAGSADGSKQSKQDMTPQDVTQTAAFKKWFGNSKVVDQNGKPKIVYHGTEADQSFTEFQTPGKDSYANLDELLGSHFAADPAISETFAKRQAGRIMPVYLSIQNPRVAPQRMLDNGTLEHDAYAINRDILNNSIPNDKPLFVQWIVKARMVTPEQGAEIFDRLSRGQSIGDDEYNKVVGFDLESPRRMPDIHPVAAYVSNYDGGFLTMGHEGKTRLVEQYKAKMKELGHDGIVYRNTAPNEIGAAKDVTSYIVFSPSQVKSAHATKFDANSRNIMEAGVDCGANAKGGGGFQPGNTCAKGGGTGGDSTNTGSAGKGSAGGSSAGSGDSEQDSKPASKRTFSMYSGEVAPKYATKNLFGKELSPDQIADLFGAPKDSDVSIEAARNADRGWYMQVSFSKKDAENTVAYEADRVVYKDADGDLVMSNASFTIDEKYQGQGLGAKIFSDQVNAAREAGVNKIITTAERGEGWNGYYTWARLGYDADLTDDQVLQALGDGVLMSSDERKISSLMKTEEGRDWWKENGDTFKGTFDLQPESTSSRVLDSYMENSAQTPPTISSRPEAPPPAPSGSGQSDAAADGDDEGKTEQEQFAARFRERYSRSSGSSNDDEDSSDSSDDDFSDEDSPPDHHQSVRSNRTFNVSDHYELDSATQDIFGDIRTADDIADMAGAPDGTDVEISTSGNDIYVQFKGFDENGDKKFYAERLIGVESGMPYIENQYFKVEEKFQGQGLGAEIFASQVKAAQNNGVEEIRTQAERGSTFNGYYTWARLGYDAYLEDNLLKEATAAGLITVDDEGKVSDVMRTEKGRDWWRENGDSFYGRFDLGDDSLSMYTLNKYMAEKASKRPATESFAPDVMEDCGANAPGGGGFQPGNTCGKGDGGSNSVVRQTPAGVSAAQADKSSHYGGWKPEWRKAVSPGDFISAKSSSSRAAFLSELSPDDLKNHKLILSKDGTVGAAVSPEGDIQNVFNNGGPKGAAAEAILQAIDQGGHTLDCFAGFLPGHYSKFGFEETGRVKFNREYAPAGWNFEKDGEPDVVFMRLRSVPDERERDAIRSGKATIKNKPATKYFDDWDAAKAESRRTAGD